MSHLKQYAAELLEQLNHHHIYQDPIKRVNWLRLSLDEFWLPEEALSLYGAPEFMVLPDEDKKTLSHYEFLHLLEAGVWIESMMMERLARTALEVRHNIALLKYHLSELREEAGHSLVFTEIIQRSGLPRVPTKFNKLSWFNRLMRHAPLESSMFWLVMLIVQDLPDRMHRIIRHHKSEICPAIVDVATFHSVDESRHISFVQRVVDAGIKDLSPVKYFTSRFIMRKMLKQFCDVYFYPQAGLYDHAGLVPGRSWASLARKNPHRIQFVRRQVAGLTRNLEQLGLLFPEK